MKKGCCIILSLVLIMLLCGCSMSGINLENLPVIKQFECDLSVNADGKEYYCHFRRSDEKTEISVAEPEVINGLTLIYENDIYSVSFKGVTVSLDDSKNQYVKYFADGFIKNLEEAFSPDNLKTSYENGRIVCSGSGEYGSFLLSFDADGRLLSMEIPDINTVITVENFRF